MTEPKARIWRVDKERNLLLADLLAGGLTVPARGKGRLTLHFTAGEPHPAYEGSGWLEVKVREQESGVESTMLYEAEEGGRVSGILRLRPVDGQDFKGAAKIQAHDEVAAQAK